eukprot:GFUD01035809.1.p1 GENE.GFUD01035809.1~~GFUD01035809.1.p1  ORF type:complete len:183 (-),score=62.91 GFUD01035809.1:206-754(-)
MECRLEDVTVDFQAANAQSKNLSNPNKSRARGPSGRKPPTRKIKSEDDQENDIEPNSLKINVVKKTFILKGAASKKQECDACVIKPSNGEIKNLSGKIDPADFDKVWFIRVPTVSCSTGEQIQEKCQEKSVENNNTSSNVIKNEIPKQEVDTSVLDEEKEKECDLVKGKRKKLKPWKTCEIL